MHDADCDYIVVGSGAGGRRDASGHGFEGWLPTSEADPRLAFEDPELVAALLSTLKTTLEDQVGQRPSASAAHARLRA